VDLRDIGSRAGALVDQMREEPRLAGARCLLELGRALVGEAGFYLTRVIRTKRSRSKLIGICDGGLNHHLAACGHFGSVIHRNFRIGRLDKTEFRGQPAAPDRFDLFGPLCTTIDQLARDVELPELNVGDVIVVGSSGAYGLTASPINFISHDPPAELLALGREGELRLEDVSQR
jgi:diaminopimelate decarboxylase